METTQLAPTAEAEVAALRAHEAELRAAGIARLTLFGSVARGEAGPESDVDLHAELDPSKRLSLFDVMELEERIGDLLGRRVDLLTGKIERPRLRDNIRHDGKDVL